MLQSVQDFGHWSPIILNLYMYTHIISLLSYKVTFNFHLNKSNFNLIHVKLEVPLGIVNTFLHFLSMKDNSEKVQ